MSDKFGCLAQVCKSNTDTTVSARFDFTPGKFFVHIYAILRKSRSFQEITRLVSIMPVGSRKLNVWRIPWIGYSSVISLMRRLRRRFNNGSKEKASPWRQRRLFVTVSTGQSRGFGFVELKEESKIKEAIAALNGQRLGGHVLTVNVATPLPYRDRDGSASKRASNT